MVALSNCAKIASMQLHGGISVATTGTLQHATGVFSTKQEAEHALKALKASDFPIQQISVVAKPSPNPEPASREDAHKKVGIHDGETAKDGAIADGIGGAMLGAAEALGASTLLTLLPGAGQVILFGTVAANALATAVIGSAVGAASGGLVGGLIDWGVAEPHARLYQSRVIDGQYLIMVEGDNAQINQAAELLNPSGLQEWHVYDTSKP
jgi:hypothetical protein